MFEPCRSRGLAETGVSEWGALFPQTGGARTGLWGWRSLGLGRGLVTTSRSSQSQRDLRHPTRLIRGSSLMTTSGGAPNSTVSLIGRLTFPWSPCCTRPSVPAAICAAVREGGWHLDSPNHSRDLHSQRLVVKTAGPQIAVDSRTGTMAALVQGPFILKTSC